MDQRFYHWRHKFGFKFVETIHAPEGDDKYDVFYWTIRDRDQSCTLLS